MQTTVPGPSVDPAEIVFRLHLPNNGVRHVRIYQQVSRPRVGPALARVGGDGVDGVGVAGAVEVWQGAMARPDAARMEYLFELEYADGRRELVVDPHNPLRAPGPFGDKSVVEMPGYRPPDWLRDAPVTGNFLTIDLACELLGADMAIGLWTAPGLDFEHEAPLIIVHDGPEYARYSALLQFFAAMIDDDRLPPLRVALLPPVDRNDHYAASPPYARALAREVVPILDWLAPQPRRRHDGRTWRIGMGASLGALATLHAHRRYPDLFGGMFLQSGSFFQPRTDPQEKGFVQFDRIATFVDRVAAADEFIRPVPVGMTCGTVEENLANNRSMRDALALQGYDVAFVEHADGHNWVGWRDSFDPPLVELITRTLA